MNSDVSIQRPLKQTFGFRNVKIEGGGIEKGGIIQIFISKGEEIVESKL